MKLVLKLKHLLGIHDYKYSLIIGEYSKETNYEYKYTQKCWLCDKVRVL